MVGSGTLDRVSPGDWDAAREAMLDNANRSKLLAERELKENPTVWTLDIAERSGRAVGQ